MICRGQMICPIVTPGQIICQRTNNLSQNCTNISSLRHKSEVRWFQLPSRTFLCVFFILASLFIVLSQFPAPEFSRNVGKLPSNEVDASAVVPFPDSFSGVGQPEDKKPQLWTGRTRVGEAISCHGSGLAGTHRNGQWKSTRGSRLHCLFESRFDVSPQLDERDLVFGVDNTRTS